MRVRSTPRIAHSPASPGILPKQERRGGSFRRGRAFTTTTTCHLFRAGPSGRREDRSATGHRTATGAHDNRSAVTRAGHGGTAPHGKALRAGSSEPACTLPHAVLPAGSRTTDVGSGEQQGESREVFAACPPLMQGRKRRAPGRYGLRLSLQSGKRKHAPESERGIPHARVRRRPPRGMSGTTPVGNGKRSALFPATTTRRFMDGEKLGGNDLKTGQRPCRLLHSHDSLRLRLLRSGSPECVRTPGNRSLIPTPRTLICQCAPRNGPRRGRPPETGRNDAPPA